MTKYTPNFSRLSTKKRIQQIIEWVEKYVGAENKILHSSILRSPEAFGNSQLGIFLKNNLLIKTCPAYSPGEFSQQYRVNIEYLNKLRAKLDMPPSKLRHNSIERRFEEQVEQIRSGNFNYHDSDNRLHNGLQHIPRDQKEVFWPRYGYYYDYDVDTCAPTLLLQRAKKLNPSMKPLDYIEFYIANKREVRDNLSIKYNISNKQVKQILNALFQGGVLNSYNHNKILDYVNKNTFKMRQLCKDEFLLNLLGDIKVMWRSLRRDINTGYEYRGDVRRSKKITGKHKSDYYKSLEREVMGVVWKYFKKMKIHNFKEHDGFRTTEFVIPSELEQMILLETGYVVTFKWEKLKYDESNV